MSYEKVKSIKIDKAKGKVYINCASNNVRPLTYDREEYPYFSNVLKDKGVRAVEIELLKNYEEGNLQEGTNKYTKALKVLRYVFSEEYKKFNWRNHNAKYGSEERQAEEDLRKSEDFKELLNKCLDYTKSEKFIIIKSHFNEKVYAKKCPTCIKWSRFKEKATKFDFREEAQDNIYNQYKDIWEIEQVIV